MGCSSSKLAGDSFANIDSAALSSTQAPKHSKKSPPSETIGSEPPVYSLATPPATQAESRREEGKPGSQSKIESSSKRGSKIKFPPVYIPDNNADVIGHSFDSVPVAPRRMTLDGKELTSKNPLYATPSTPSTMTTALSQSETLTADEGRESLLKEGEKPILRTDQDRKNWRDPKTGKGPGWYARYTNRRLGVGEERDPVTGRGLITGLTKEETIARVRATRGPGDLGSWGYATTMGGGGG